MKVLAAIHDLMFSSKVNAAAKGKALAWLPRGTRVVDQVAKDKPDVLLIDLAAPALDSVNAVAALKGDPATKDVTVIGYADHTREDLIDAARKAGCDRVMSKGEFARRLPEILDGI